MAPDQGGVEGDASSRPDAGIATEAEELTRQVRERVERRRAAGFYGRRELDNVPFSELALNDDLAASANRLAAAADIEGLVPDVYGLAPHELRQANAKRPGDEIAENGDSNEADEPGPRRGSTSTLSAPDRPLRAMVERGSALARRAMRAVVGERVDRFLERSLEYFAETALFAELATRRILELEARVAALEEAVAASGRRPRRRGGSDAPSGSATSGGSANFVDVEQGGHDITEPGGGSKRRPNRSSTSESKRRKP